MATTTKRTLRREAADLLGGFASGEASAGGVGFLIDAEKLLSNLKSTERYIGTAIKLFDRTNAGKVRLIATYLRDQGRVNFDNVFPEAVQAGDEYELYDILDPDTWDRIIDRALPRCTHWRTIEIVPVADQLVYDLTTPHGVPPLADADWLELAEDVTRCVIRTGDPTLQHGQELPAYLWTVEDEDDRIVLKLRTPVDPTDPTTRIVLRAVGPYEPLANDDATTTCPREWALAAILTEAYEKYGNTIEAGSRGAVNIDQEKAAAWFTDLTTRYAPEISHPIGEAW